MATSQPPAATTGTDGDLLTCLQQGRGWSEAEALEALGAYLMSTEAGQRLRRELPACNRARRAA